MPSAFFSFTLDLKLRKELLIKWTKQNTDNNIKKQLSDKYRVKKNLIKTLYEMLGCGSRISKYARARLTRDCPI